MSSRRASLTLAKRAQRDVKNIELYSLHRWGAEQAVTYLGEIEATFETLRENPRIGRSRSENGSRLRSFPAGHHVVFNRTRSSAIRGVRILHGRADPARLLKKRADRLIKRSV